MFTGIIEDIGNIENKDLNSLTISTVLDDIKVSDSVSVNGVCLTVEHVEKKHNKTFFKVTISSETLQRTNLKFLTTSSKVNLERALRLNSRLSGHIVTGHVDTTIELLQIKGEDFIFELPKEYEKYIVEKGSVAIDGISLTVAKKFKDKFLVVVVPYTFENTTLKYKKQNDVFNLEVDILAKYVESIVGKEKKLDIEFLKQHGFA